MIWDWDLWPARIAYGAWLAAFGAVQEAFTELIEATERVSVQMATVLLPVFERLAVQLRSLTPSVPKEEE